MDFESRFLELGEPIPPPIEPPLGAPFALWVKRGSLLYLSGHGSTWGNNFAYLSGKVGSDLSLEDGKRAARVCTLNLLQTTRQALGNLNAVKGIIDVFGMVNATNDLIGHSQVLNGCSELLLHIFGETGMHSRVAMGASSLPFNFAVEIKMIIEI